MSAQRHDPIPRTVVIARNDQGRPTLVEHRCSVKGCGRLITGGKHV